MIMFNETSKCYYNKNILSNINLNIEDGDFILLVGENGSGKSTLLKLIAHVIYPDKSNMIKSDMYNAYLPEKFNLPKDFSTKYFIKFLEEIFYIDLSYYVSYLEIPNKKIRNLSKGNLQKLGLLAIIASKMKTILLDEPCEGMDKEIKKKFINIVSKLNKEGRTIIVSTHDIKDYSKIKARRFVVSDGQIRED